MDDLFNLYSDFVKNEFKIRLIQKLGNDAIQVRFTVIWVFIQGDSQQV